MPHGRVYMCVVETNFSSSIWDIWIHRIAHRTSFVSANLSHVLWMEKEKWNRKRKQPKQINITLVMPRPNPKPNPKPFTLYTFAYIFTYIIYCILNHVNWVTHSPYFSLLNLWCFDVRIVVAVVFFFVDRSLCCCCFGCKSNNAWNLSTTHVLFMCIFFMLKILYGRN